MNPQVLTEFETKKVLPKIIKSKPRTAREIAELLGYSDPRAISRALGRIVASGEAVRDKNGAYRRPSNDS